MRKTKGTLEISSIVFGISILILLFQNFTTFSNTRSDFNGDRRSDVIFRNVKTGQVYRLLMNGQSIADEAMIYSEPNLQWKIIETGDFNADKISDIVWQNSFTEQIYIQLFNSNGIPSGGSIQYSPNSMDWKIMSTPDINGDTRSDIILKHAVTGEVKALISNGLAFSPTNVFYKEPNLDWQIVAAGDFFGYHRDSQIVWRNKTTGQVYLMTLDVSGQNVNQSGTIIYQEPDTKWQLVGAVDFDGDYKSDILWRNEDTGQVFLMLMNGKTISQGGVIYQEANKDWQIIALGDYDGDNHAEILWRNRATGQVYQIAMNGLKIVSQAVVYTASSGDWVTPGPLQNEPISPPAGTPLPSSCSLSAKAWGPFTSFRSNVVTARGCGIMKFVTFGVCRTEEPTAKGIPGQVTDQQFRYFVPNFPEPYNDCDFKIVDEAGNIWKETIRHYHY